MVHEYFSDRELGKKELKSEEISVAIYNGIVGVYISFKDNFSSDFPDTCPDNGMACGTDVQLLNAAIKAQIPNMETPVSVMWDEDEVINKYALLDFVEFCYSKITDVNKSDYHSYFKHHHIFFPGTNNEKEKFRVEVNQIFARNGVVFYLDSDGMVKRHLPTQLDTVLQNLNVRSKDDRLNELVNLAIEHIRKPKEIDRQIALEKIWDAFERIKTFYDPNNKKTSAQTLVSKIAAGTPEFEDLLDVEFKTLTDIGNKYQIRHFEANKIQITSMKQVDYLFYRMIALIDICMDKVNNEK
ncbi:AbiJ-NTD4 domain-containing protein [Brevibacillus parabrevis]|uniref:AbiJ-NTD4 domain-containing protein n=1 Tax=Brevibacillus parabrevis TaxID=54914 RepID=UPI003D1E907C